MADYYPLIARAIAGLDPSAPGQSRRALYERARIALVAQLRSVQPPLSESEVTRERLSLEEAVRIVESEAAQRARDASRANPAGDAFRRALPFSVPDLSAPNFRGFRDIAADADDLGKAAATAKRLPKVDEDLAELAIRLEAALLRPTAPDAVTTSAPSLKRVRLPPISVIPEQNEKKAIAFGPSRRGPLDLLLDPPKDPLDTEQGQLYTRIRAQLVKIKEDVPSQERSQIDDVVDDFLAQPAQWSQVEYKKVLWLCGNALRNLLAQHDAVKISSEPHYSKLPPSVAEALRRPVEGWNVFALGDTDLVELDAKRLGPQEQLAIVQNITAATPILENAAKNREITTEQAGKVLDASLKAASVPESNINVKQAQDLADGTSRNLIVQIVRRAYLFCQDIIDPQSDEARTLALEYKKGIAKGAGAATVGAMVGGVVYSAPYAASFFEFVAANAGAMKDYIAVAFQNAQLSQVIDAIEYTRQKLNSKSSDD